jgi:hypothetical protein
MQRKRQAIAYLLLTGWTALAQGQLPRQAQTPGLAARMLNGPMKDVERIVLAERAPDRDGHWYANFGYKCHAPNEYVYGPGGGKLLILNVRTGQTEVLLDDPAGGVRDPVVDYDAQRVLFSYRPGGTHRYHLYEIDIDGSNLRRITKGNFDDYEPCYLPDGGIMFVSSRCYRWVPCWYTQVGVMYRCERDGSDVRQISFGVEHENHPWVLPDGRVLYTRWEYVDRHTNGFHHLWTVNPDGTAQMIFYGNLGFGELLIDAKPIPGSRKIATIVAPGHGKSEHQGDVFVLDGDYGPANTKPKGAPGGSPGPARQNRKGPELQINRHTRATDHPRSMMSWRDVLPISERAFLVCCQDGLYVMDHQGNFEAIYRSSRQSVAYEDRGKTREADVWVHEPRLLAGRKKEPVIPSRTDDTATTGTMVLADVYEGRNMAGVERGQIRKLLVMEELPRPISMMWSPTQYRLNKIGQSSTIIVHRVLGTVPVEADGSAHFEVPAHRPLFFVALDENDVSVKRMQSFVSVMPGERVSCVGCHENRIQAPHDQKRGYLTALTRPADAIAPVPGVPESGIIDFPRDIQPLLDKHCTGCHNHKKRAGGIRLDGARNPWWTYGYNSLIAKGQTGMAGKYFQEGQYGNMPPRSIGSAAAKLLDKVAGQHHDVVLSGKEHSLLRTWIDSSAAFAGTQAVLAQPEPNPPRMDRLGQTVVHRKCGSCHMPAGRTRWPFDRNRYIDLDRIDRSLLLRAPLAVKAGGLGLCRKRRAWSSGKPEDKPDAPVAAVFASADDPDYQALKAMTLKVVSRVSGPAYWQKGFVPGEFYFREMKRCGVLEPSAPVRAGYDWFALEERYYNLFYAHGPRVTSRPAPAPQR